MTLREAFEDIEFRKGTWIIYFCETEDDVVHSTELCAETLEELELLWNDYADEEVSPRDGVVDVEESFDAYFGGWFGSDKGFVIHFLEEMLNHRRDMAIDAYKMLALRAAIKYIDKANVDDEFWVDGVYFREEGV